MFGHDFAVVVTLFLVLKMRIPCPTHSVSDLVGHRMRSLSTDVFFHFSLGTQNARSVSGRFFASYTKLQGTVCTNRVRNQLRTQSAQIVSEIKFGHSLRKPCPKQLFCNLRVQGDFPCTVLHALSFAGVGDDFVFIFCFVTARVAVAHPVWRLRHSIAELVC